MYYHLVYKSRSKNVFFNTPGWGSLYASPDELLQAVTGKPLDPNVYIRYLQNKYEALYKL